MNNALFPWIIPPYLSVEVFSSDLFPTHESTSPRQPIDTHRFDIISCTSPNAFAPPSAPVPSPCFYRADTCHAPSTPPGSTPNQTRHAAPRSRCSKLNCNNAETYTTGIWRAATLTSLHGTLSYTRCTIGFSFNRNASTSRTLCGVRLIVRSNGSNATPSSNAQMSSPSVLAPAYARPVGENRTHFVRASCRYLRTDVSPAPRADLGSVVSIRSSRSLASP